MIPAGTALVLRLIPGGVMADARDRIQAGESVGRLLGRLGALIVLSLWVLTIIVIVSAAYLIL